MKKIFLLIASLVTFYGCEYNNPDAERHLKSIYIKYLILKDDIRYYQNSGGLITLTNSNGDIIQRMHFNSDNLILIEGESFDPRNGQLIGKREIFFEDYGTNPNPLEGKFYIIGAFYRAFSKNNFTKYTIKSYLSLDGVTLELFASQTYSIPLIYDKSGYPLLGQYE